MKKKLFFSLPRFLLPSFLYVVFIFFSCQPYQSYYNEGRENFAKQKDLAALVCFTKTLEKNPHHAGAHFYTARLLEKNEISKPVALQHYLSALQNFSKKESDLRDQTIFSALQISLETHEFEKAKELADSSLEHGIFYPQIYLMASKAALALNDKQGAKEYAESGLEKFADSVELTLQLGDIVNQEYKQYYLGLQLYQHAEELAPQNAQVFLRLAFGYNLIGNYVKATHYLDMLIQNDSDKSQDYLNYQKLLALRGWKKL